MDAKTLYKRLESYFEPEKCTDIVDKIGIQYDNAQEIKAVYISTFADLEVIENLIEWGVEDAMLFTHHPLPQREGPSYGSKEIPEILLLKMKAQRISLFSYHIPLDRNGVYSPGNNLARVMEITPYEEFYEQNQVLMGVLCQSNMKSAEQVKDRLERLVEHPCQLYDYGDLQLQDGKIAIMAGGASNKNIYQYLKEKGINTFVTGITNSKKAQWIQEIHQKAKEYQINLIGGTHYSTEKFACMAMVDFFQGLGISAEFIETKPDLFDL